jgi:tellurite resistance protein TerC
MAVLIWIVFVLFVLTMVMLDLGVFHRKAHVVGVKEALAWTAVWIMSALAFNVLVYFFYAGNWFGWTEIHSHDLTGREAAIQYFTGYVLEKSLSVDNIFVIALIFAYFAVPLAEQHRVLFWGILGAVVLRGVMIAFGAFLISRFEWIIYVFGAFLIFTAVRMLLVRHEEIHPDKNPLVRLVRKIYPVASEYPRGRFFTRVDGRRSRR